MIAAMARCGDSRQLLAFEGLPLPLLFEDAGEVADVLHAIVRTWPLRDASRANANPVEARSTPSPNHQVIPAKAGISACTANATPALSQADQPPAPHDAALIVARDNGAFTVCSPARDVVAERLSAVEAACCLLVELVELMVAGTPEAICLHAGAAMIGGRLVVLAGDARAGKSTLAVALAARGHRLFCDDMLPVRAGRAVALGIAPRLRLPLPEAVARVLADYLATCPGPTAGRYGYVLPPSLAPHGETAPLGAIVVLDRRPGPTHIERLPPAATLTHLLRRNFARDDDASAILGRLQALTSGVATYRLHYETLDDACSSLENVFLHDAPTAEAIGRVTAHAALKLHATAAAYRRAPGISTVQIGETLFLASDATGQLVELNAVGALVWDLLADADTPQSIAKIVAETFAAPPEVVAGDIARLLADLTAAGFAIEASPRSGRPAPPRYGRG